ncbi:MAG: hypothetical protein ACJ8HI_04080 [Massilia sp.]
MPLFDCLNRGSRMLLLPLAVLMLSAANAGYAQDSGWRGSDGQPVANSASMRSEGEFGATLLVTPDADWEQKWNTPVHTIPSFKQTEVVKYGDKVTVLIFFANPKLDAQGSVNVRCDIKVFGPAGAVTSEQKDLRCFDGPLKGSPTNVYLSRPAVVFSGDATDPPGKWIIKVNIRDENRPVGLDLQTGFELKH